MNNNNNNNGQRASFAFFARTPRTTTDGKGKSSLFSFLLSSDKIVQKIGRKSAKESFYERKQRALLRSCSFPWSNTDAETRRRRSMSSEKKTRSFSAPRVPSRKTPPPVHAGNKNTSTTQTNGVIFPSSSSLCAGTIKPTKNEDDDLIETKGKRHCFSRRVKNNSRRRRTP